MTSSDPHKSICYDDEGRLDCACGLRVGLEAFDDEVQRISEFARKYRGMEPQLKDDVGSVVGQNLRVDEPVDGRFYRWKTCAGVLRAPVSEVGDGGNHAPV